MSTWPVVLDDGDLEVLALVASRLEAEAQWSEDERAAAAARSQADRLQRLVARAVREGVLASREEVDPIEAALNSDWLQ